MGETQSAAPKSDECEECICKVAHDALKVTSEHARELEKAVGAALDAAVYAVTAGLNFRVVCLLREDEPEDAVEECRGEAAAFAGEALAAARAALGAAERLVQAAEAGVRAVPAAIEWEDGS